MQKISNIPASLSSARALGLCLLAALVLAGAAAGDAYRRQELDAKLMDAAKPMATGASMKKCSHCGATVLMQASFCGECGAKL